MACRKRVDVKCPNCRWVTEYWVAKSAEELVDVLFCNHCGESFNRKGEIVLV